MLKIANKLGFFALFLHLLAFVATVLYRQNTHDPQASFVWAEWVIVDFPISLLYWAAGSLYNEWMRNIGSSTVAQILYLPHLIHGVLGSAWWYLLPRLFLQKRLGGVWGSSITDSHLLELYTPTIDLNLMKL